MEVDQDRSDPELVELFIEEAKEEVANIARQLPAWTTDLRNSEALIAVRRSFHTLKGSGRMVGAQLIGEFAWSIENLLNRLINQTLSATPAMVEFVATAAKRSAGAHRAARDRSSVEDRRASLDEAGRGVRRGRRRGRFAHVAVAARAGSIGTAAARRQRAARDGSRARRHLRQRDARARQGGARVSRSRRAACRAAPRRRAALPSVPHAARQRPDGGLRARDRARGPARGAFAPALRRRAPALTKAGVEALRAAAVEIERMADALVAGRDYSLGPAMPAALAALAAAGTQPAAAPPAAAPPAAARPAAAPSAGAPPSEAPATAAAPRAERPAASAAPEPAGNDVYDAEIAAIFAEEAAELLDNAEVALRSLRQEPSPAATVELQRLLHTLKGGARMAGITAMGALSHALETLLERIAGGHVEPAATILDVVQRSLDELQQMRDAVAAGRAVTPAGALVGEIERAAAAPAAAAPEPAVAPPPAPASAAPPPAPAASSAPSAMEPAAPAPCRPCRPPRRRSAAVGCRAGRGAIGADRRGQRRDRAHVGGPRGARIDRVALDAPRGHGRGAAGGRSLRRADRRGRDPRGADGHRRGRSARAARRRAASRGAELPRRRSRRPPRRTAAPPRRPRASTPRCSTCC